ncbi:MAG TPA: DHH family phosphoesterase [Flavipsychrobacter sp.]|nr:DHH family phosphoesterase [Flavipsychrobacter sp.]
MKPIQDALLLLQAPRRVFITTHHKPDGDAIGSMLGLYHYLVKRGHSVVDVSPSELPDFLMWMPGVEHLYNYEAGSKICDAALRDSEVIFCVDFNDYSRTKHLTAQLEQATQPKILIDHHLLPKPVWDYGMSLPEKSSTCEMIYDFINLAGDNELIDETIASCLYTGVLTDTGSFRFNSTAASTHRMVADLKEKGLAHSIIHEHINDSWSLKRMQFLGYILLEKMEVVHKYNSGIIALSREDLKVWNVSAGDTEGLVNYPLNIAGIRFSTLITERGDEVKLSFRSKGNFDVSTFAREHFNGGGHFNASGGRSNLSFSETVARFKEILSDIHPR